MEGRQDRTGEAEEQLWKRMGRACLPRGAARPLCVVL